MYRFCLLTYCFIIFLLTTPALAEQLFTWSDGTINIEFIKKSKKKYLLRIKDLPQNADEALLKKIIDDQLASISYPKYFSTSKGSFSVGQNKDKFKLDFYSDSNGTSLIIRGNQKRFTARWHKDGLNIIRIKKNKNKTTKIDSAEKKEQLPPKILKTKRDTKAARAKVAAKTEQKVAKEPPVEITTDKQHLIDIKFNQGLHLKFNLWPEWRLTKVSAERYELSLTKCKILSPALKLPYYAPTTTTGLIKALASEINKDTKIIIDVEKGFELKGSVSKNTLNLIAVPKNH